MEFSEILRRLRERAGLTQSALAEKTGLSKRTIESWEQGRRAPVSPDFFTLVAALNVSADAFAALAEKKPRTGPRG